MTERKFELLLGTANWGKTAEIRSALRDLSIHFLTLEHLPMATPVEESGATYEENAVLKATAYARQFGIWTLADDSGLEVEALGGEPGVLSARYAGSEALDGDRISLLLGQIAGSPINNRRARFVTAIALADSNSMVIHVARGVCEGRISDSPRGSHGFGYDPIFVPHGYDETFGELPSPVKDAISHRGKALGLMRAHLKELIATNLTASVSNS